MALVVLKYCDSGIEAAIVRSFLSGEGIMSFPFDVNNEWDSSPRIGARVRLMVAQEDLDDAAALLRTKGPLPMPGAR